MTGFPAERFLSFACSSVFHSKQGFSSFPFSKGFPESGDDLCGLHGQFHGGNGGSRKGPGLVQIQVALLRKRAFRKVFDDLELGIQVEPEQAAARDLFTLDMEAGLDRAGPLRGDRGAGTICQSAFRERSVPGGVGLFSAHDRRWEGQFQVSRSRPAGGLYRQAGEMHARAVLCCQAPGRSG